MEIIRVGKIDYKTKRLTCNKCKTIFEVEKSDCSVTSDTAAFYDGMKHYNVNCPICKKNIDFDMDDWMK